MADLDQVDRSAGAEMGRFHDADFLAGPVCKLRQQLARDIECRHAKNDNEYRAQHRSDEKLRPAYAEARFSGKIRVPSKERGGLAF